jgi:putative membrane protein
MTSSTAALPDATKLALERTRLAYERTLMAWVRTSTSLISFGFTIYKFFQYLRQEEPARAAAQRFGPRAYAVFMIGIGVVALVFATLEHRRNLESLRHDFHHPVQGSLATVLAALISLLGTLGLVAVLFRW